MPGQFFGAAGPVIRAGSGARNLAFYEQIDASPAGIFAAPDEKIDVFAFDIERRGSEPVVLSPL